MKFISAATASLVLVAVAFSAPLAVAQVTQPAAAADNSTGSASEPIFLPGVVTPTGLDSSDGSGVEADAPMLTTGGGSEAQDHSKMSAEEHSKMGATPTATAANSSVPTPTPKSGAQALVSVGVIAATAATAVAVALL